MEWFGCRQQMKMFISKICSDDDHRVEYRNKSTIVSKHANTFQEIQYLVHYQHLVMEMHFDLLDQSISWASLCIPNPSQEPPFPPSIKQNHIYPSPTLPLFSSTNKEHLFPKDPHDHLYKHNPWRPLTRSSATPPESMCLFSHYHRQGKWHDVTE
jgi:hypothetical protein